MFMRVFSRMIIMAISAKIIGTFMYLYKEINI